MWTVAHQAPLSMEFSRQEYWSGSPLPSPGDLPDPESNPGLLHSRQILYHLSCQGSQGCGTDRQWNITQPQKRMKNLQQHGWT